MSGGSRGSQDEGPKFEDPFVYLVGRRPAHVRTRVVFSMIVADRIVKYLEEAGAKYVFGVPGSTTVALISSISKSKKVKFISALHEDASLGMADGYSRAGETFSTALLHTTPGLTTALPNLYNSYIDDLPLLVIVGDVNSKSLIKEPALALNGLIDTVKPMTKWAFYASSSYDALAAVERALTILHSSEPGPCCVIVPEDLLEAPCPVTHSNFKPEKMRIDPEENKLKDLLWLIDGAKWPVLLIGREIRRKDAVESLAKLCSKLSIPAVLESPYPSAYAVSFPQDHPCYLGVFRRKSEALKGCDLVVALGGQLLTERKFYEASPFPPITKVVHISSNSWELGKNMKVDMGLLADPTETALMLATLPTSESKSILREHRRKRIEKIRQKNDATHRRLLSKHSDGDGIKPWLLVKAMKKALSEHKFSIVDEGVVVSSYLSELFEFTEPGSLIGRSAGCLGWGVSAAVGAKLALPKRKMIAFVGDGALLFGPQALWTASHYDIPITVIVCNNGGYASVNLSFDSFKRRTRRDGDSEGCSIGNPALNISKLAEGFGARAVRVVKEKNLGRALDAAFRSKKVVVVDVAIDPQERGYEGSVGANSAWT